jgi:hypothetical protein
MKNLNSVSTRGIEVGDLEIEEIEIKNVEAYQKSSRAPKARKRDSRYHYSPRHRMVA